MLIPRNETDVMLVWLREFCDENGRTPTIAELEAGTNFRLAGPVTRLLRALCRVGTLHIAARRGPAPEGLLPNIQQRRDIGEALAKRLAKVLMAAHTVPDEGDDPALLCASEIEITATLIAALR